MKDLLRADKISDPNHRLDRSSLIPSRGLKAGAIWVQPHFKHMERMDYVHIIWCSFGLYITICTV